MKDSEQAPARGRPKKLSHARIVEAGMAMGLRDLTFVGLAASLGVTHMTLYNHIPNLDALKGAVAEAIFDGWQMPPLDASNGQALPDYLIVFIASLRDLVIANPGLTPYLLRRSLASPSMSGRIAEHQTSVAAAYGLPAQQARWLLSTVAFHCVAVAETLYASTRENGLSDGERARDADEVGREFAQGMHALVLGALQVVRGEVDLQSLSLPPPAATPA